MASSPQSRDSRRRRALDTVKRGFCQVKEIFRSTSSSRPTSPPGNAIVLSVGAQSLSPAQSGSFSQPGHTQLVPLQGQGTPSQAVERTTAGTDLALPTGSAPSPQSTTLSKLKDASNVTWSGLEMALYVLEKSADAFPPLKSAVGGLIACLDIVQVGVILAGGS